MRRTPARIVTTLATAALAAATVAAYATPAQASPRHADRHPTLSWDLVQTPTTTARLRGLSPVSARVAWASGSEGTVLRTVNGGRTVESVGPPGTSALQFRSLYAAGANHAVIVSIGDTPDAFRAYVTDDGGRTWTKTLQNTTATAFYDCVTFVNRRTGYILGDPVDGKFQVIRTTDGGHSWNLLPSKGMPPALTGEFAFAASSTCIQHDASGSLYIASGGVDPARVFKSTDRGLTWTVQDSPVAGGASAGIFSLTFGPAQHGAAVGGDFLVPDGAVDNAAYTTNAGLTWKPATGLGGYRSGSSALNGSPDSFLAVGPTGSDVSWDGGRTYAAFDDGSFDSVECVGTGACWASGEQGRLATLVVEP